MTEIALGKGWILTVGGRHSLRVTFEYPGSRRGYGNDARSHTTFHTGDEWNSPQSCRSNVGGNMGTTTAMMTIERVLLAHFVEVRIDCDAVLKSEEGLPELPLPADFLEALDGDKGIRVGLEQANRQRKEEVATRQYGGWVLAVKSLRKLPDGVEAGGLQPPYAVALIERPSTYGLGLLGLCPSGKHVPLLKPQDVSRWPEAWREVFAAELAAAHDVSRAGERDHLVPADEMSEFFDMIRRARAGRGRRR